MSKRRLKLGQKLRSYKMGDLNPWSSSKSGDMLDEQIANYDSMSRKALARHYADDTVSNTGPFYGVVYRVERNNSEPGGIVDNAGGGKTDASTGNLVKKLQKAKVYIPTIHAMLNEPVSDADHFNIEKLHTFVAIHANIPKVNVGDVVLVDYMNLNNLEGPVLIDLVQPLKRVATEGAPKMSNQARAQFDRCSQSAVGCLVSPNTPAGTITSQLQSAPKGIFSPTGRSRRALIIADENTAQTQGKVMQQFLAEVAKNRPGGFRGLGKNSPPDLFTGGTLGIHLPAHFITDAVLDNLEAYFVKDNTGKLVNVPDLIVIMLGNISPLTADTIIGGVTHRAHGIARISDALGSSASAGLPATGVVNAYKSIEGKTSLKENIGLLDNPPEQATLNLAEEEEILRKISPAAYLLYWLKKNAPASNILWIGANPHVSGYLADSLNTLTRPLDSNNTPLPPNVAAAQAAGPEYYYYREDVVENPSSINGELEGLFGSFDKYFQNTHISEKVKLNYGSKAFFVDPIRNWDTFLPEYMTAGFVDSNTDAGDAFTTYGRQGQRDGVFLDQKGAIEMTLNLARNAELFGARGNIPLASSVRSRVLARDQEQITAFVDADQKEKNIKARLEEISARTKHLVTNPTAQPDVPHWTVDEELESLAKEEAELQEEYIKAKEERKTANTPGQNLEAKAQYRENLNTIKTKQKELEEMTQRAAEDGGCMGYSGSEYEKCVDSHNTLGDNIRRTREEIKKLKKSNIEKEEEIFHHSSECAPWKRCDAGPKGRVGGNAGKEGAFTTNMIPKKLSDIDWNKVPSDLKRSYNNIFMLRSAGGTVHAKIPLEGLNNDSHPSVKFATGLAAVGEVIRRYWLAHPMISDARLVVTSHGRIGGGSSNHSVGKYNATRNPDVPETENVSLGWSKDQKGKMSERTPHGASAAMDMRLRVKYVNQPNNQWQSLPAHLLWAGTIMLQRHARIPGRVGLYLSAVRVEHFPEAQPTANKKNIEGGPKEYKGRFTYLWAERYKQLGQPSRGVCSYTPGGVHLDFGKPSQGGALESCFGFNKTGNWFRIKATDHGERDTNDIKSEGGNWSDIINFLKGIDVEPKNSDNKVGKIKGFMADDPQAYAQAEREHMVSFFQGWWNIAKSPWNSGLNLPSNPNGFPILLPDKHLPNWMTLLGQPHKDGNIPRTIDKDMQQGANT